MTESRGWSPNAEAGKRRPKPIAKIVLINLAQGSDMSYKKVRSSSIERSRTVEAQVLSTVKVRTLLSGVGGSGTLSA